jgi:hypothetical protein
LARFHSHDEQHDEQPKPSCCRNETDALIARHHAVETELDASVARRIAKLARLTSLARSSGDQRYRVAAEIDD